MNTSLACQNMIKQQLRTNNVTQEELLNLYKKIPRDAFVPAPYETIAYSDMALPLPHAQHMLTPLDEGRMLQALALQGHEKILEIGTGSGFFTALLSQCCQHVVSVDLFESLTQHAQRCLDAQGITNVSLLTGNAVDGWMDAAPYHVIVLTGSVDELTETLRQQLLPHGKLLALIQKGPITQAQLHSLDDQGQWHEQILFETRIDPLLKQPIRRSFLF